jgi:hypothetical protein
MLCLRSSLLAKCALGIVGAWFVLEARDARACGGCFHEPAPVSVVDTSFVTDHRMAFSMSPAQTVLWDQVRFSGNPKDFAWVLPVKPGARIELSHDEWIAALDASTQTVITGPTPRNCGGGAPTEYESGGGGGCGFGGFSSSNVVAGTANIQDAGAAASQVQVISQQVVGPYDAVTVRSSQGEALGDWLRANGYSIPASIQPTIDAYSSAGFDFIALKLAPATGVQAMRPVRVVTPGADPTLPLRMVAAGVGAHVGLELYVLSEGRYHPANFPDATIDFTQLAWDPNTSRSNYTELMQQALATGDGTGWLTESSQLANMFNFSGPNPGLAFAYQSTCQTQVFIPTCPNVGSSGSTSTGATPQDAATPINTATTADAAESGSSDAASQGDGSADSASTSETGATSEAGLAGDAALVSESAAGDDGGDAAPVEASSSSVPGGGSTICAPPMVQPCDDLSVAMVGIAPGNLWVTRLRADFPSVALSSDLVLEATPSQAQVTNRHTTNAYTIANYDPCKAASSASAASPSTTSSSPGSGGCACRSAESRGNRYSDAILLSTGAVALALSLRRRRSRATERDSTDAEPTSPRA